MESLRPLGLAVKRLQWRHQREAGARLAALGVSLPQWDVLRHLAEQPDASLHALAVLTFQTDPSMGTLAARMVDRGLLDRVDGPGRAVRHTLTRKGERIRRAGGAIMDEIFAGSLGRLTRTERRDLARLLAKANPP